jgi:two-component system sensor histidine kinase KdpD
MRPLGIILPMKIPGFRDIPRSQRLLFLLLVGLVIIAVIQVQWWIVDQQKFAADVASRLQAVAEGRLVIDAAAVAAEREAYETRHRQYSLEGAFFLTVLTACLAGVWRSFYVELSVRRRQESFLELVSHQFKTPLASLRLAVESLMIRRELPASLAPVVGRAYDDVQRLENLITNILESARLDEGRVRLSRDRLAIGRCIAQTVDRLGERARRAGARFEVDVPSGLEVLADPVATDAVLRNLLENAIAAVAPVGTGTIRILARESGEQVEVEIVDTGVGFDLADASRLFDKFNRTDPEYRSSERTGLGLNIAQRLMQLGGGDIRAHSEGLGKGASFCVVWPRAARDSR